MAPPGPSVISCGAPVRFHQIKMLDDTTWNSRPSRTGRLFEDNITTRIWNGVGVATLQQNAIGRTLPRNSDDEMTSTAGIEWLSRCAAYTIPVIV